MARNKKNFNKLIKHMEGLKPKQFDMRKVFDECGCIESHCIQISAESTHAFLDISITHFEALCFPHDYYKRPQPCDLPAAIAELKRLRDGGRPDPMWLVKARAAS